MADSSKSVVSRGALERVLARAAELQAATGEEMESTGALTDEQVIELGREVGLSPDHLRQALAEERAQIAPLTGGGGRIADQLIGVTRVAAQRVIKGKPHALLATIDRWMQREQWLRILRQRPDRHVWEPRRGFLGSLRQIFSDRGMALYRANDVAATVVPVDQTFTLVRLEADFSVLRRTVASQTIVATGVGVAASSVAFAVMNVVLPLAIVPAIGVSSLAYASARRTQRQALERGLLTLEQVLDRLERGDTPQQPALIRMIEAAIPPSAG